MTPGGHHRWDVAETVRQLRRSRPPVQAALLGEDGIDPLQRAQPGDPVLPDLVACRGEFIGDEPVPERRVVLVDVERDVDQMGVVPVPLRHRIGTPLDTVFDINTANRRKSSRSTPSVFSPALRSAPRDRLVSCVTPSLPLS